MPSLKFLLISLLLAYTSSTFAQEHTLIVYTAEQEPFLLHIGGEVVNETKKPQTKVIYHSSTPVHSGVMIEFEREDLPDIGPNFVVIASHQDASAGHSVKAIYKVTVEKKKKIRVGKEKKIVILSYTLERESQEIKNGVPNTKKRKERPTSKGKFE